jgi:hypothetical protein
MGVYYKFANFTDKEVIDGWSAKSGEWRYNRFDQSVIVNYLMSHCYVPKEVKFISDESGEWDECDEADFKDVTAKVIYDMFEDNWFDEHNKEFWNSEGIMKHILRVFQRAGMEEYFHKICDEIPEFDEFRKKMVCVELER